MIRIVGAMLILFSSIAIGNKIAIKYRKRPQILQQIEVQLEMVSSEINYAGAPLPEVLSRIGSRFPKESGKIFLLLNNYLTDHGYTLEDAFKITRKQLENQLFLEPVDWDTLENLTMYLGKSDSDEQIKQIELCLTHLRGNQKIAIEERRKNERMWRYLGVLAGLMLVILTW